MIIKQAKNDEKSMGNTKNKKYQEQNQKKTPFFGTIWSSMDSKMGPKTVIFPNAFFFKKNINPWDLSTLSADGPIPNASQKALFCPMSQSKRS